MKTIAFIPARLASTRFPNKVLLDIKGLPMVEHVRRRALLSANLDDVFVVTCDEEIREVIEGFDGKVIMTGNHHMNGTSRVIEAVVQTDCTHALLLQGDEPLLYPSYIDLMLEEMKLSQEGIVAWNATGDMEAEEELDKHSFVKCQINHSGRIIFCFRRSPCFSDFQTQKVFIRKMLGIIAFKRDFLLSLDSLPFGFFEKYESIEQMRIIENGYPMQSISVSESLPSINEPSEVALILNCLEKNEKQKKLLNLILASRK